MPDNAQADPEEKKQAPSHSWKGRGYRVRVLFALINAFFWIFFAGERLIGAQIIRILAVPFIVGELWRRRHDYTHFKKLREVLPAKFWKGRPAWRHYYGMIRDWNEGGGVALLYSRLGRPYWQRRFTVKGPMPAEHPEWGKRPVVFAFMHTGPFTVLVPWLRSRGIATAALVGGLPLMADTDAYRLRNEAANHEYGLADLPMFFERKTALRDVLRYLTPGHGITVALDGGKRADDVVSCRAGDLPTVARKGACRIALQTGALIIPIAVRRTGMCRFEVRFGQPVPDELLSREDFSDALQYLIDQLWPGVKEHPEDITWTTLEALAPALRKPRIGWP